MRIPLHDPCSPKQVWRNSPTTNVKMCPDNRQTRGDQILLVQKGYAHGPEPPTAGGIHPSAPSRNDIHVVCVTGGTAESGPSLVIPDYRPLARLGITHLSFLHKHCRVVP